MQEKTGQDEDNLLIMMGLVNLMGLIDIINFRTERKTLSSEKSEREPLDLTNSKAKNSSAEALMGLLGQLAQKNNRTGSKNRSGEKG